MSARKSRPTSLQQEQQCQFPVLVSQTRGEEPEYRPEIQRVREPAQQPQPTHMPSSSAAQSNGVVIDVRDLEHTPVTGKDSFDVELYYKQVEDEDERLASYSNSPPRYSWTDC